MIGQTSITVLCAAASMSYLSWTVADTAYTAIQPAPIEGKATVEGVPFPGELVTVKWDMIKRTPCPGQASRVWSGQNSYSLSEALEPASLPQGAATYRIPPRVPLTVPPGEAKLTISGFIECKDQPRQYFTLTPVVMQVDWPGK